MADSTVFSLRKGTTNQFASFKGSVNEVCMDTDKKTVVVMDGNLNGGYPLAREDLNNVTLATMLNKGVAADNMSNVSKETLTKKGLVSTDLSNLGTDAITNKGIALSDASNIQDATTAKVGVARFATNAEVANSSRDDIMISPASLKAYMSGTTRVFGPMFIQGLGIDWQNETTFVIGTGSCRSKDDSANIILNTPMYIVLVNTMANTTYHVFLGINNAGKVVCRYYSSLDPVEMVNEGYHYRRVGSFQTDNSGGAIRYVRRGNNYYYISLWSIEASNNWSSHKLPTPADILHTPFIQATATLKIGLTELGENCAITNTVNSVVSCIETVNELSYIGTGVCIGYSDTREFD
jgi:hypothetical protein